MRDLPKATERALAEAAHRLQEPYATTYRRLMTGELSGRRIGARWYVLIADVERLEAERAEPVAQLA